MSDGMLQHFQQLYRSMETEALIDLQRKGTLRPEAEEILYAELETRPSLKRLLTKTNFNIMALSVVASWRASSTASSVSGLPAPWDS
jgi:hypothetical protein